jgi:hypothetical protein
MKRHPAALAAGALLALLAALPLPVAGQDEFPLTLTVPLPNTWIGIIGGRFAPADAVFKEVYGTGGLSLGLSAGRELFRSGGFTLAASLDVRRFACSGLSTVSQIAARLSLVPVSATLETHFCRGAIGFWLGGGADLVFYTEDSEWIMSRGSAFGFHVIGGLLVEIPAGPVLKAYIRWSSATKTMEDFQVGLGGTEIGGSILFRFRL